MPRSIAGIVFCMVVAACDDRFLDIEPWHHGYPKNWPCVEFQGDAGYRDAGIALACSNYLYEYCYDENGDPYRRPPDVPVLEPPLPDGGGCPVLGLSGAGGATH